MHFVTALRPLGIVPAEQSDKLEFGGQWPLTVRDRCNAFRYFPDPLGIVPAEQYDKLEFAELEMHPCKDTD